MLQRHFTDFIIKFHNDTSGAGTWIITNQIKSVTKRGPTSENSEVFIYESL